MFLDLKKSRTLASVLGNTLKIRQVRVVKFVFILGI